MQKQKVKIEIDVPSGYEFVRLDETYDSSKNEIAVSIPPYAVCRPQWQWPQWLTANYIAMDADGKWYAYLTEPSIRETYWWPDGGVYRELGGGFTAFLPPPCDNWKKSVRRNPNNE